MKLFRFLFWLMVFVVALALTLVGALFTAITPVFASEWKVSTCERATYDAAILYDAKAQGVTWEEAEPQVMMALDAALHNPQSYVKDAVDVQRSYEIAQFIWAHDMPLDPTLQIVYTRCVKEWVGPEV